MDVQDGRFGLVQTCFPLGHSCGQTVTSRLAQSVPVLQCQGHGASTRTDKRTHDVIPLSQPFQILGQGAVVVPGQKRPLKHHSAQRVAHGQFQTGGGLHQLHARQRFERFDLGVDLRQEAGSQRLPFKADNQKVVVAAKRFPKLPIKRCLWMVSREELFEVVIELQSQGLPSHPARSSHKESQHGPRPASPRRR